MSAPRIVKKVGLSMAVFVFLLGIPAVCLWYYLAGPGYYAAFHDIKNQIIALPNIELIRAGGNQDITYEDIWAEVLVKEKGRLQFFGLTRKSLRDTKHISLGTIGSHDIIVEGEGFIGAYEMATGDPVRSQFYGGSIDIGRDGAFARFFPFEMRNIQDVIARYDDINAIISEWPVAPDKKHFKGDTGTDYYYYVKEIPKLNPTTEVSPDLRAN